MSIKVTYVDGTTETLERPGYYLYTESNVDRSDDNKFIQVYKNKNDPTDESFDEDDSSVIAELQTDEVRKLEYG